MAIFDKKNIVKNFSAVNYFKFSVIKTLDPDLIPIRLVFSIKY